MDSWSNLMLYAPPYEEEPGSSNKEDFGIFSHGEVSGLQMIQGMVAMVEEETRC